MKAFFWKLYFWITCLLFLFILVLAFRDHGKHIIAYIFNILLSVGEILGISNFLYQKPKISTKLWKIFLGIDILAFVCFLLYQFLPKIFGYLSILDLTGKSNSALAASIDLVFSLPTLYALYQVAQGKSLVITHKEVTPEIEQPTIQPARWNMIQTAFWGYSSVFILLNLVLALLPIPNQPANSQPDILSGVLTVLPIALFWLVIIIHYKRYHWNWWKMTLVLNSVLYIFVYLVGSLFPHGFGDSSQQSSEFDYVGIIELGVIFVTLIIFGREQFHQTQQTEKQETVTI